MCHHVTVMIGAVQVSAAGHWPCGLYTVSSAGLSKETRLSQGKVLNSAQPTLGWPSQQKGSYIAKEHTSVVLYPGIGPLSWAGVNFFWAKFGSGHKVLRLLLPGSRRAYSSLNHLVTMAFVTFTEPKYGFFYIYLLTRWPVISSIQKRWICMKQCVLDLIGAARREQNAYPQFPVAPPTLRSLRIFFFSQDRGHYGALAVLELIT